MAEEPITRRGRRRKWAGWALVVAGLLPTALWLWSGWRGYYAFEPRWAVFIKAGVVTFERWEVGSRSRFSIVDPRPEARDRPFFNRFEWDTPLVATRTGPFWLPDGSKTIYHDVVIAIWPIPVVCFAAAAGCIVWSNRARRRATSSPGGDATGR